MNKLRWGIVILVLLMTWTWQQWPDGRLKVIFCDVGQGDGALVVLGSFQALVDTGRYENKMTTCLGENMPFWDRSIEVVFLSHSDIDHVGAFEGIKKRYRIGRVVDNPGKGDVIRYGNLSFDILKGSELVVSKVMTGGSESNESSVVMQLIYGSFSALFTGDIDTTTELAMVEMGVLKESDVLKVSHHGSKYGSAKEFLDVVKPKMAIISVGAKNSYGHPHGDTLLRLDVVGAKVLRTDILGTIIISTDGQTSRVYGQR